MGERRINPQHLRHRRVFRERPDYFEMYNGTEFSQRFRLSKNTARFIINDIRGTLQPNTNRNHPVPPTLQVLCLRYYATGSYQKVAGDLAGLSCATVCRIVRRVSRAIADRRNRMYIQIPGPEESTRLQQHFRINCAIPWSDRLHRLYTHSDCLSPECG